MNTQLLAVLVQEGTKLISEFMRYRPLQRLDVEVSDKHSVSLDKQIEPERAVLTVKQGEPAIKGGEKMPYGVSDAETIAYQEREVGKQLTLMEIHFQQGCKIDGTPCDCCEKHPMTVEALAEETYGMTGDPKYARIVEWVRALAPITTAEASASGKYDGDYPRLALEARQFRKQIMGTEDLKALLGPKERQQLEEEVARNE